MRSQMMRGGNAAAMAGGALLLLLCHGGASAAPCDEHNPTGPSRSAQITLGPGDFVDADGGELRSFVATGSIGTVESRVVSAVPPGIVAGFSALPEISRFSPHEGEELKGIAVTVHLNRSDARPRVVIGLRQVCARYFRNTFLYY
jgi:hypothetical protein